MVTIMLETDIRPLCSGRHFVYDIYDSIIHPALFHFGLHGGAVVRFLGQALTSLRGVRMLSLCQYGFSPGTLASSHRQKIHAIRLIG